MVNADVWVWVIDFSIDRRTISNRRHRFDWHSNSRSDCFAERHRENICDRADYEQKEDQLHIAHSSTSVQ